MLAILAGEPRPAVTETAISAFETLKGEGVSPTFPLAGADLVAAGVAPGPGIGRGLATARKVWLELGCPTDAEARADLLARALEGAR